MTQRLCTLRWLVLSLALAALTLFTFQHGQMGRNANAATPLTQVEPVRFIAFGDMGTGDSDQYALAKRMAAWHDTHPYDTALLLGDNIYPDGDPADLPAKFERPYAELLLRGIRFQASLGNHDVRRGRAAQINYPNFNMGGRAYYSFTRGVTAAGKSLAEFYALDTTAMDAAQLRWLEGALAASQAQWKLAFFHHPLYSSATTHGSDAALRAKLEPLFVRYGVAAVFSGHDHTYERTKPLQGVQYFVSGAASGKLRRGDLNRRSQFFVTGNDESGSFLYAEVTQTQLNFQAVDVTGRVFDTGSLAAKPTVPHVLAINTPVSVPDALPKPATAGTSSNDANTEPSSGPTAKSETQSKENDPTVNANARQRKLTADAAHAIALQQVPGTVESSELKRKDGQMIYDVKVRHGRDSSEVRINADDGTIVRVKHK
jgi:hypothetical protein